MLDRAVRIGMIGCGTQANVHFTGIKALGGDQATVAAVCDLDDERLAAACQLWPAARAAKDYRDMLALGRPRLSHRRHHAQHARSHVLGQPRRRGLRAVRKALYDECRPGRSRPRQGRGDRATSPTRHQHALYADFAVLARSSPRRHHRRARVRQGVGLPRRPARLGAALPPSHFRRRSPRLDLVHTLDLAMWVGGSPNPLTVSAATRRLFPGKRGPKVDAAIHARYDAEDLISGLVRFDNGAFYSLEGNWCSEGIDFHSFELTTTRATVTGEPFAVKVDVEGEIVDQTPQLDGDDDWFQSVHTQDATLIAQFRAGEPWDMQDARQLLNLQKVVDACYESARTGREVTI